MPPSPTGPDASSRDAPPARIVADGQEKPAPTRAGYERLQEISSRLIPTDDIDALYEELVTAAIDLAGADSGTMQSLDEDTGELCLLAARGLPDRAVDAFARVSAEGSTSCALAMQRGGRVIVSDYMTDEPFAGTEVARQHLNVGVRAAHSTPLLARSGRMVGMLTTHWSRPHAPDEQKLRLLDILARQAADLIERCQSEEILRQREERLRELNRSLEERVQRRTAELQQQAQRLRHLATELASTEQRERKRLAALLHDNLQQLLYGAEMQLTMTRGQVKDNPSVATAIEEASEWIGEAVEAARGLARQLRPPALYEVGLTSALTWLASQMAERHNLAVTVDSSALDADTAASLSDDLKAMLFDCVRELLFNVVKYAGVDQARVVLRTDAACSDATESGGDESSAGCLHLIVEDEGGGFDVEATVGEGAREGGGFGLFSIHERIAALGGATTIDASPGTGTRVDLMVPLEAAAPEKQPSSSPSTGGRDGAQSEAPTSRARVRTVIADDHAVVRQGIANLLAADERIVVVGEAADGREAVDAVEQHRPDAVLMDVNMPKMNGVDATRQIRHRWSGTAVIRMSVQANDATAQAICDAGAAAFVPKSGDADRVIETILRVTERASQAVA